MPSSRLHELSKHGVSVWMDSLSREMLETGELTRLMEEDAVVGVTSNPTIFEKALSTGPWYDDQLRQALTRHEDSKEIFLELAVEDVRRACDLLHGVWERSAGIDGYVSIEVDPELAYDREATFEEAMRLHELVDRHNVYVKIPGTEPGLGAIEDCIARGRSINVTLIFSLARHAEVAEAYVRGLERLVDDGGDPSQVISVASFFVSRVDTGRTGGSRSSDARTSRESWRSPMPSSPTSATSRCSPGRGGRSSPRRERGRSGASGRRPRRRTPPTATSSTSRSSSAATP
jgi:transaldolase